MAISVPVEGEWISSAIMPNTDGDSEEDGAMDGQPPVHPVPTMQGAFEESMAETMNETDESDPEDRYSRADSVTRRKLLLEQDEYERTVAGRWKQKPGEKFHPLWKLVAQISFGMHLLQQELAKSDEEVIKILQTHVDEVDGFLERTTEDFDHAQGDIGERIRYLRLPLEHGQVFDQMLNDRNFRVAIVEGNEKIEHIIDRTSAAMNDALKDVQKGLDATRELAKYLTRVDKKWDDRTEEHNSVYLAMIGNTEGWTRAFLTLQSKGNTLRKALVNLGGIVAEMQRRAGTASRRNLVPSRSVQGRYYVNSQPSSPYYPITPPKSPNKPLPHAPERNIHVPEPQHHDRSRPARSPRELTHAELVVPYVERTMPVKKSEAARSAKGSGLLRRPKSPESVIRAPSPQSVVMQTKRQEQAPSKSYEPMMRARTLEPEPVQNLDPIPRARSPETRRAEEPMEATPPVPARSASHRVSFTKRTRSLTRKLSFFKEKEEKNSSNTDLPIQGSQTSSGESSAKRPISPAQNSSFTPTHNRSFTPTHNHNRSLTPTQIRSITPNQNRPFTPTHSRPFASLHRRLSSRNTAAMSTAISMSTYSQSPTSTSNPLESPVTRDNSPQLRFPSGGPVPSHNSYGSISFLPMHPLLASWQDPSEPIEEETERDVQSNSYTEVDDQRLSVPTLEPVAANKEPDTEGNVNTSHPLLMEARHTKFGAIKTSPGTPARNPARDLPLRHYHSQDALGGGSRRIPGKENQALVLPKRTSSLISLPHSQSSPDPESSQHSKTLFQSSATPSPLHLHSSNSHLANSSDPVTIKSPISPTPSSDIPYEGATPPPISRVRSPSLQNPTISKATRSPKTSHVSPSTQHTKTSTTTLTAANPTTTITTPQYLKLGSSNPLVDFLNTTPPPSSPYSSTAAAQPPLTTSSAAAGASASTGTKHYQLSPSSPRAPFNHHPGSEVSASMSGGGGTQHASSLFEDRNHDFPTRSPPCASGAPPDKPLEKSLSAKVGWKKVFGSKKEKSMKGDEMFAERKRKGEMERAGIGRAGRSSNGNGNGNGGANGNGGDAGFMGVGKDGVWISRKNFLKT